MLLLTVALLVAQAPTLKVYRGDDGQVVSLVWLAEKGHGLVQVKNGPSEIDGLWVPVMRDGRRWVARLQGSDDWGLVVEYSEARRVGGRVYGYEVSAPGGKPFDISFDAELTAQASVEGVSAERASQAKRLAAVARKPFPFLERKYQRLADEKAGAVTASCGHALPVSFEWGSFSDSFVAEVDVWKACEPIVTRLIKSCTPAKAAQRLVCRGGSAIAFAIEGEEAIFTTTRASPTQAARFLSGLK